MLPDFLISGARVVMQGERAIVQKFDGSHCSLRFSSERTDRVSRIAMELAYNSGGLIIESGEAAVHECQILTPDQIGKINRFRAYIEPMELCDSPGSKTSRLDIIKSVAGKLGETLAEEPSENTLYKWHVKYRAAGRDYRALLPAMIVHQRKSQVSEKYHELFDEIIAEHYLTRKNPKSASATYDILLLKCDAAGYMAGRPSKQTWYKWIDKLDKHQVFQARQSGSNYRMATRIVMNHFRINKILERVELDAVYLNIGIVDADLRFLGSVIVYVAIDTYSRSIMGTAVKVGTNISEDASTAIECLQESFKVKSRAMYPFAQNDWAVNGVAQRVVTDPGAGVIAGIVGKFLLSQGITHEVTPAKQAFKKPFIEGFFAILRERLMKNLPGYVGKRTAAFEIGQTVKKGSCMELHDFKEILYTFIIDDYQQEIHSGLRGRTPAEVWAEGAELHPPRMIKNMALMHVAALESTTRKCCSVKGIRINVLTYQSRALQRLCISLGGLTPKTIRLEVRWSKTDLSRITVVNPKDHSLLVVPVKKDEMSHLTLEEGKAERASRTVVKRRRNATAETTGPMQRAKENQRKKARAKRVRSHPESDLAEPQSAADLDRQLGIVSDDSEDTSPSTDSSPESPASPAKGKRFGIRGDS